MIPLQTLRTALLSHDPYEALDRLVRAEMGDGRTTNHIFNELNGMLELARDTPGLTEDGEEALFSILDALTGNCKADQCFRDPPNTSLPSKPEIEELHRWVRVAFATRCARRALPYLVRAFPTMQQLGQAPQPSRDYEAVFSGIKLAEDEAATGIVSSLATQAKESIRLYAVSKASPIIKAFVEMTECLLRSTGDRELAEENTIVSSALDPSYEASRVCELAHTLIEDREKATRAIRRDFDHIASLARWGYWTDDTPVSPEVFGPLWPEGPPPGWPPATDVPQWAGLSLSFLARDRAVPQMLEDDVVNLFEAINRDHSARGGVPLTHDDLRAMLPALVPAEL